MESRWSCWRGNISKVASKVFIAERLKCLKAAKVDDVVQKRSESSEQSPPNGCRVFTSAAEHLNKFCWWSSCEQFDMTCDFVTWWLITIRTLREQNVNLTPIFCLNFLWIKKSIYGTFDSSNIFDTYDSSSNRVQTAVSSNPSPNPTLTLTPKPTLTLTPILSLTLKLTPP